MTAPLPPKTSPRSALGALSSPIALPVGTRDLLPARAALRRALAHRALETFARWGYDQVIPPAFEREAVLARGLGPRARGELVRFLDPDTGEVLALRPDMTPQVARIVATRYPEAPRPVRLAYEGSVVRRPRARARRQRQRAQAGIECVGWHGTDADAEAIATTMAALTALGLEGLRVELSHAGLLTPLVDALPAVLREPVADALTARDTCTWQDLLHDHPDARAILEALDGLAGDGATLDAATHVPALGAAFPGPLEALGSLREALMGIGLGEALLFDLGELRGRGYYTGVFFQVFCPGSAEAVATGGRYDDLLGRYGVDLPATGAALDLEAVEEALSAQGHIPPPPVFRRVLVTGTGEARRAHAARLRAAGCQVAELEGGDPEAARAYAEAGGFDEVVQTD